MLCAVLSKSQKENQTLGITRIGKGNEEKTALNH